jgi:hypothetical protein
LCFFFYLFCRYSLQFLGRLLGWISFRVLLALKLFIFLRNVTNISYLLFCRSFSFTFERFRNGKFWSFGFETIIFFFLRNITNISYLLFCRSFSFAFEKFRNSKFRNFGFETIIFFFLRNVTNVSYIPFL